MENDLLPQVAGRFSSGEFLATVTVRAEHARGRETRLAAVAVLEHRQALHRLLSGSLEPGHGERN